ncbi:S9 family peptidase [Benzoatithermus flavus]|uniref:S9 family peptidase n=1 Tax=Benzoatithermus flavus TaxID=3108223 RepID=A0ABU8XY44_9PROT
MTPELAPPTAPRRPTILERFGIAWTDEYAWLRDPSYPEVKDPAIRGYLEAENAYADAVMAPHRGLIERLHAEFKGRIKEDDRSVPVREGMFEYHWQFFPGAQYRTWFRRRLDAAEAEILLDERQLAEGLSYFNLRALEVSPDGRLLAYTTDEDGSERYGLHLRNLETGEGMADLVGNTSGAVEWAEDGRTLLYVELNDKLRPFRVRAHRLGQDPAEDRILYEEADPAFFVSLAKTRSRCFILIASGTHVTREIRLLDAADPESPLRLVARRREEHRYGLDHAHGRFWILTNDRHENFRLVSAPEDAPEEANWREEIPGDDRHYLLAVSCFQDFMVLSERSDGLSDIRIRRYDGEEHVIDFPEPVYTATLGDNREFATDRIRVSYTSMVTPPSVIDYVVGTRELIVRKEQEIPSGYDKSRYVTRRLMAPAPDGVEVPITIVHRKDFPRAGGGPLFLYGYGSYGHGLDPAFAPSRLSLLDRGMVFAYAHVRGGDEMGYRWYRDGKLFRKKNSFTDFIACAEYLIREGYTQPGRIAIKGGSAGGMLMGAVTNMRPELWGCVIAEVPFVDVLNTMLDASLPLTPIEWPEWGNPIEDRAAFEYIRSYSPYDNIRPQAYPPMLVTAGISDPRVTYWEPAKFVARLRATKTDEHLLLLRTNMDAGHFGKSGRFDALLELAEQYAFMFHCLGLAEREGA